MGQNRCFGSLLKPVSALFVRINVLNVKWEADYSQKHENAEKREHDGEQEKDERWVEWIVENC